jgi:hypothetical protein
MLLEHAFQSSPPAGSMNVPSYLRWHLAQDGRAAYDEHARFLRFLQWQKRMRGEPVGPFVLKAPHHMVHLERLLERHPGATIIQTHRDPLETLPSLASMALELRRLTSDTVHPSECADYALTTARCRSRAHRERAADGTGGQRFVDVWFGDIVTGCARGRRAASTRDRARPAGGRPRRRWRATWPRTAATSAPARLHARAVRSRCRGDPREFAAYRETHVLPRQRGG